MSERSAFKFLTAAAMTVALCAGISCQSDSRAEARKALDREVAQRRVDRERSMKDYAKAVKAYDDGKLDEAGRLAEGIVARDSSAAQAWMLLGRVNYDRGQFSDAIEDFDRASQIEPQRYEPLFNLGIVLETVGRFSQAAEKYESALRLAPGQLEVSENLARAYARADMRPDRVRDLVERAMLTEQRPEWRRWLALQQARLAVRLEPATATEPARRATTGPTVRGLGDERGEDDGADADDSK